MAVNASLRQEIEAALETLSPQIRGLEDLLHVSLSSEALQAIGEELADHQRRKALLLAVITALDAVENARLDLGADGYPEMPKREVSFAVYEELLIQLADIEAALEEFEAEPKAANMEVVLGEATDKP